MTREVGRLELCLDAVKTTLSASKEETNVAQMRADEAHARAASKISLKSLSFYIRALSNNSPFSLYLVEQLATSRCEIEEARR